MTAEILKEILNEKAMSFTLEEIMQMLDEELEKPLEQIDEGIIDSCLDALKSAGVL